MLLQKGFKRRKNKRIISIAGVTDKMGVTHISLAIANYIESCLRERVIYIELAEKSKLIINHI